MELGREKREKVGKCYRYGLQKALNSSLRGLGSAILTPCMPARIIEKNLPLACFSDNIDYMNWY